MYEALDRHTEFEWRLAALFPEARENCVPCATCQELGYRPRVNLAKLMIMASRYGVVRFNRPGYNLYSFAIEKDDREIVGEGTTLVHGLCELLILVGEITAGVQ